MLEGDAAAGFASNLVGFEQAPIIIATTAPTQKAHWLHNPYFSFSQIFFANIAGGDTTWNAYRAAQTIFSDWRITQTPYLDTNNDGLGKHRQDGRILRDKYHTIGRGLISAGDEPLIGDVQAMLIPGGIDETDSITLAMHNITSTSALAEVYGYVVYTDGTTALTQVQKVVLVGDGQGGYSGTVDNIQGNGEYVVQFFARNSEGYVSLLTDDMQLTLTINDTDNDGIDNSIDPDNDNDGVPNETDAFPFDDTESVDTDGDGIGNNADTDDDGDGVIDEDDLDPLNPNVGAPPKIDPDFTQNLQASPSEIKVPVDSTFEFTVSYDTSNSNPSSTGLSIRL
ncbi:MAG: thrombospondin type 3 repeat-containing protein, partial [Psychrosphaera sp.]|nr:thrombospondin type 3 repeat-containing protein [Psychrosphaera sp.]